MITDIFSDDPTAHPFPRHVLKLVPLTKERELFTYRIDFSSGYFLRRIFFKAPQLLKDPTLPKWTAETAYVTGDIIQPSAVWQALNKGNNVNLIQTAAPDSSGLTEPKWPRTHGDAVPDGNLSWTTTPAYNIQSPRLKLELFDRAKNIVRQTDAVYADLIGTPGSEGAALFDSPLPVDLDRYGLSWNTPHPPTSSATLNFLYEYGDTIRIEITGQKEITLFDGSKIFSPNYCDLFLLGYLCPTQKMQW